MFWRFQKRSMKPGGNWPETLSKYLLEPEPTSQTTLKSLRKWSCRGRPGMLSELLPRASLDGCSLIPDIEPRPRQAMMMTCPVQLHRWADPNDTDRFLRSEARTVLAPEGRAA